MKIVIDIPEEAYELLKNEGVDWLGAEHILNAVANGTLLPKRHGRLIDEEEFSKRLVKASMFYCGETADMFDTRFADGLREANIKLSEAPTIIEAESEEE